MSTADECVAGWCATERWCAVACAADVLGRKWHPVIVTRLLADGPLGFTRLESDVEGLSDTVLSASLADLQEKGIVERRIVSDRPLRVEYALTERGASLEPVLDAMAAWGREQLGADG
ncbi:MAG TPA: helix-turn-helix domain-containing protein [Halobacteriales archaeon]|nr:helix-turn-helix domain-containing protein [Halobacteriales archaeon]